MTGEPARTRAVFTAAVDQATAGYRLPLAELVPAAGRAGFPVLEVPAFALTDHRRTWGQHGLVCLLERHQVRIGQLSCGTGIPADLTVPAAQWPQATVRWQAACRLAASVGCPRLSLFVPRKAADAEQVAVRLRQLARVAADHALEVSVEMHAPALLPQAVEVLRHAAVPTAGLLVDVTALALAGLDPAPYIAALPPGAVRWAHLADLPQLPAAGGGEQPRRVLPGAGCLPLARALTALRGTGFSGPVAVEVPRGEPYGPGTAAHLTRAARSLTGGPLAAFFTPGGDR
ncbi:sugar phosphate isomerase/epimerase family protein [Streptomyces triculaminicus]|uniref:sugar phosphate isomerase/epimerase family protein n=1 Tax=Streptomyces triculaminicus TaxID=2816232 RepID=UPI0037CF1E6B